MSCLSDYSYRALEDELARRDEIAELLRIAKKPKPLQEMDWAEVVKLCESYIDAVANDDPGAKGNLRAYIIEAAIVAVFGSNVWEWINKETR